MKEIQKHPRSRCDPGLTGRGHLTAVKATASERGPDKVYREVLVTGVTGAPESQGLLHPRSWDFYGFPDSEFLSGD